MLTEKLTYEDIVTKTVEALLGTGLNTRSIQGCYCKYYNMLGKYLDARGIRHYDSNSIGEFLQLNEERYSKKEIKKRHYCALKRAIRILIEYVEGDVIPTLEAVCHAFGITLAQFFAEGEMVEMSPELKELFEGWVSLTPDQKDAVLHVVKAFANPQ